MKRNHLRILTVTVILVAIWVVVRWTGMFQMYRIPTLENSPTLSSGDWIYVSNLWEPERMDFVCIEDPKENVFIYRLMAQAGEVVEIRESVLYINAKIVDKKLRLKHNFVLHKNDYDRAMTFDQQAMSSVISEDSMLVSLADENSAKIQSARRYIEKTQVLLHKDFSPLWTPDNLGPITVPKNHIFLLGDNRHNAKDSRFIGFIPEKYVTGVVLNY